MASVKAINNQNWVVYQIQFPLEKNIWETSEICNGSFEDAKKLADDRKGKVRIVQVTKKVVYERELAAKV